MKLTLPYLLVAVNLALGSAAYAESPPSFDEDTSDTALLRNSIGEPNCLQLSNSYTMH
ncbi:hypothetical protein [Vibrio parahaemolyticus]|uniref:hypothetical protein n=1 Tax=Vibrio parahaemolyticus TaxID=670 RepID=UPI0038925D54